MFKEINDFLGAVTGMDILVNRVFEINMQVSVANKDKKDMLNKVLETLESNVVNSDNLAYNISEFINIGDIKVENINVDRFFI